MFRWIAWLLVLGLVACGGGAGPAASGIHTTVADEATTTSTTVTTTTSPPADTTTTTAGSPTTSPSTTTTTTTSPPPDSTTTSTRPPETNGDVITPQGFWEVRIGETLAANEARIGGRLYEIGGDPTSCLVLGLPEVGGLYFIAATPTGEPVEDRDQLVVGRVSADRNGWLTDTGIEVGMSVQEAEGILGDTIVERRPHAYIEGGEYLVVGEPDERYVFETDGSQVVEIHAGFEPVVSYIEACS